MSTRVLESAQRCGDWYPITDWRITRHYAQRMNDVASIASIPSAMQSATSAISRAGKAVAKDAAVVASSSVVDSRELIGALVDSRQQVLYTAAAAKLISASDEMMQSLIDVRA
jgi:hypothetical protein